MIRWCYRIGREKREKQLSMRKAGWISVASAKNPLDQIRRRLAFSFAPSVRANQDSNNLINSERGTNSLPRKTRDTLSLPRWIRR